VRAKAIFLSPAGAILTLVSFFLPWAKVSCAPVVNKTVSGASLGGALWLVLPLATGILVSFFYYAARRCVGRSRPFVVVASVASLAVILTVCLSMAESAQTGLSGIASNAVGMRIQFGGVATLCGLVLSLAGALLGRAQGGPREPD